MQEAQSDCAADSTSFVSSHAASVKCPVFMNWNFSGLYRWLSL